MWFLCFLPGCELQGHLHPVLPQSLSFHSCLVSGVRREVPKSVLELKPSGMDEPDLQGPALWL